MNKDEKILFGYIAIVMSLITVVANIVVVTAKNGDIKNNQSKAIERLCECECKKVRPEPPSKGCEVNQIGECQ